MIVAYQPGGSIRDAIVVLRFEEKIPTRYNNKESIIYRESEEDPRVWLMVKPKFSVLAVDSELLAQPVLPEVELFPLTTEVGCDTFEHIDIIKICEPDDNSGSDSGSNSDPVVP